MPLGYDNPFGVPQVGVLKDVKDLPWTYRDFDRWTSEEQRAWTLSFLRSWLPLHPLVTSWRVEEASHIGTSTVALTSPILRLFIYTRASGWFEGGMQFPEHVRADQNAFVSQLLFTASTLAEAAGA